MSLESIIRNGERIPLSNEDLSKYFDGKVNIVMYNDLNNTTIEKMLSPYDRYIMLYQFPGQNVGHWVCGFRKSDGLHVFDPYGLKPDQPFDIEGIDNPQTYSSMLDQYQASGTKVIVDSHKYQHFKRGIDTCGRHVFCRVKLSQFSDNDYEKVMLTNMINDADKRSTLMTLGAHVTK